MRSKKIYTVYMHTSPTGKSYIGQTRNLENRSNTHKYPGNNAKNNPFSMDVKKYGWDRFNHSVLYEGLTSDEANSLEEWEITQQNTLSPNGYNLHTGGRSHKVSNETREKHIAIMSGTKASVETKHKMSMSHLGIKRPDVSAKLKGVKKSLQARKNMSIAKKGKQQSPESIAKRADALTGRKLSPESIAKRTATRAANRELKKMVAA